MKVESQRAQRRGALQSMELLVVLPVLILIGAGLFQFGMFFIEQQRLQSAVDAACRIAAQQHGSSQIAQEKASAVFYESLGHVRWASSCQLEISFRMVEGSPVAMAEVQVPSQQVQPNLLGFVGLGLNKDDRMSARAIMPCL
jgi:Flp pilus assembly protein TadG